jgi:pyridoxal phosphate enzyme (YggS family)
MNNFSAIQNRIAALEIKYLRPVNSIKLVAISKKQSADAIKQAFAAGIHSFGESYLQEALDKMRLLQQKNIEWHFVGNVQSNKTKIIAENFSWVQSIAQLKIAERLHAQRPSQLPPLNCLIQVNLDAESSKSGVAPDQLLSLAEGISKLANLRLRGLMFLPRAQVNFELQRQTFKKAYQLFTDLKQHGFAIDTLSMGMSEDFEAAIAEGATMVRIGRALFGERE